jgi:hypothetical protein
MCTTIGTVRVPTAPGPALAVAVRSNVSAGGGGGACFCSAGRSTSHAIAAIFRKKEDIDASL